jgi:hypothetical protein
MDSLMRRAIVLRICVRVTSLNSPSICMAVATAVGAAFDDAAAAAAVGAVLLAATGAAASAKRIGQRHVAIPVAHTAWCDSVLAFSSQRDGEGFGARG